MNAVPSAVDTSFKLWVLNVVLSLVSIPVMFIGGEKLMTAGVPDLDPALAPAATAGLIVAALFILVASGIEFGLALRMRAGRNWARMLLAILGVLSLLLGALSIDQAINMLSAGWEGLVVAGITLIGIPLTAAAIVYMYLPGARAHFTAPTGPSPSAPAEPDTAE
jgi:hypothetical protein